MEKATLKALRGSIAKWKAIAAGRKEDEGWENCPLCQLFLHNNIDGLCHGCPVYEKTKQRGCWGTPYEQWDREGGLCSKAISPQLIAAAKAEVKFLERLLPLKTA